MAAHRSLIITALSLLGALSADAEMQCTPRESEYELDGIKLKQLLFSDGSGKQITYQQPAGWHYSGSAATLTLHPPNKSLAEGSITVVKLSQPGSLDEATLKKLTEEALSDVPKGSTNVALVAKEKNAIMIDGKETFLVLVSYTFFGENYERSSMFLNRGSEQIHFRFVSRAADFNDLQRAFLASQFTWHNL